MFHTWNNHFIIDIASANMLLRNNLRCYQPVNEDLYRPGIEQHVYQKGECSSLIIMETCLVLFPGPTEG